MRQASKRVPDSAEKTVRDIRRATRQPSGLKYCGTGSTSIPGRLQRGG